MSCVGAMSDTVRVVSTGKLGVTPRRKRVANLLSGVPLSLWLGFGESRRWSTRIVVAVSIGGAFFIGENADGVVDWVIGIVLVLVPFVQQLAATEVQEAAEQEGQTALAEFWVTINKASAKMNHALRAVLAEKPGDERQRRRGQLEDAAVHSAFLACSGKVPHARAVFFKIESAGRRLRADTAAGRVDETRRVFEKGTHPAVFDALVSRRSRLVADNGDEDSSYRTYCSVPVYVGSHTFGMLSLDSPEPGSITEREQSILELFAGMLAAGLVGA